VNDIALHAAFGLGGGLGAVARHLTAMAVTHRLPLATLIVNVAGCLILGVGVALLGDGGGELRRLVYGFCGGLTTFSTFAYQSLDLHRSGTIAHAAGNILGSLGLCLLAFWAGLWIGGAPVAA
jgi:CrcB protein